MGNATTKKFLRLVNDGSLQYDNQRVYHEGYKPTLEALNLPAGIPFPWPSDEIPYGWLLCNGAKFSASDYPELARAYPNLTLPDLRGEFIRGADNGRGVDNGRQVMSWQAATLVENWGLAKRTDGNYTLVTRPESTVQNTGYSNYYTQDYDARESMASTSAHYPGITLTPTGLGAGTGFRVRPRNIAFNYIVRAA
ncbi:phage tail protein [Pantoea sp. ICBG 1758]|nr:phage tail protein [Pantoea sp. ICBG 1758]